ncbi:MAG: Flp family type IVb pilin [Nocardioides sp.]
MTDNSRARDQRGASAVEYGLLITGIAAVIALVVFAFGGVVRDSLFGSTCTAVVAQVHQVTC